VDPVTGADLLDRGENGCAPRTGPEVHDFRIEALVGHFRFRDMQPEADALFVKLGYRFRM
jgi:hypothetical protein